MEHVSAWLQAYHDGELAERRRRLVEMHLERCERCRAELDSLQTLSSLLHQVPSASAMCSEDRFVSEVGLRLPRRSASSLPQVVLLNGWRLVPVALVALWVFVRAVSLITDGVLYVLALGAGGGVLGEAFAWRGGSGWVNDLSSGMLGLSARDIYAQALRILPLEVALTWGTVLNLVIPLVMALAFWSWLGSLWVRNQRQCSLS